MPQLFIETQDDLLLFDRIESFGGGMDGYTRSTLLAPDTHQYLENCVISQNLEARTRPGADALGNQTVDNGAAAVLQGLAYYDTPTTQRLLTAKGNSFYKWDGAAWSSAAGFTVTGGGTFIAAQGVDKLLISDAVQHLQLWDGTNFTDIGNLGPIGASSLTFAMGRMFACGFPGTAGAGRERDALWPSLLLQFDANGWLPTNSIRVGAGDGDPIITAAEIPTTAQTQYLVCVMKRQSVWLVNADPTQNPSNWQVLKVGPGHGIVGKKAFCVFGNDLLIFTRDGVRSVRRMQSAAGQYELSPAISLPLQPWVDRINWNYASGICAVKFKEYALFAVPLDNATSNNTVLAYNGRLQKWVGVWTGWTPVSFAVSQFSGVAQLNIADTQGRVNQWKDTASLAQASTYTENGASFPTKVWTRSSVFQDMINPKDGYFAEARFTDGNAVVNVTAIADLVASRSWVTSIVPTGPTLPVALNFVLGGQVPTVTRRSLRGLSDFNEIYLRLESSQGWFSCRNITLAAFLNMLDNQ